MNVNSLKLPSYFYNINAILPNNLRRWYDEFFDEAPSIIQPNKDLDAKRAKMKHDRNVAYSKWQAAFHTKDFLGQPVPLFKPKTFNWQAIRVLAFKHSESNSRDWWEHYQDAVFRVFVNPETVYDKASGEHKQGYLLSPEDGFLVNERECLKRGKHYPVRDFFGREKYLSAYPELRCARFIPVECCHHLRHETTGGELPEGL